MGCCTTNCWTGLPNSGPPDARPQRLQGGSHGRFGCRTVSDQSLNDIGVYQSGLDTWLVLAPTHVVPASSQAPVLAARALQLANEVRARGARCGERSFGSAPPVRLSGTLAGAALGYATHMAQHNYFEHEYLAGRSLCGVDSFCRKRSPIEWTRQAAREPSLFRVTCSFGGGG
jgi:hypothetical protein